MKTRPRASWRVYGLSYAQRHDPPDPPDDPPDLTEAEQRQAEQAREWAAEERAENRQHARTYDQ